METFTKLRGDTSFVTISREKNVCAKQIIKGFEYYIFEREIKWLERLQDFDRTPDLIKIDDTYKILLTSYCGEPLKKENMPYDWDVQVKYIYSKLQEYGCCHNDIKPGDLLINKGKIMLCDFGWATEVGEQIPTDWPKTLGLDYAFGRHNFNDLYSMMKSIFDICHATKQPNYCKTPNMHTHAPRIEYREDGCVVTGYQKYFINENTITPLGGNLTNPKTKELFRFFQDGYMNGKTFLDLGAANGLFSFCALGCGASKVTSVDIDNGHLEIMKKLKERFNFKNISIVNKNITDYDCPADVVFALALIHWIYSCTSAFGSLNAAVSFLKKLTKESLFVEWIDPSDSAIEFFKHTKYNRDFIKEPYNKENFISALKNNFTKVEKIADIIPTRQLYLAVV